MSLQTLIEINGSNFFDEIIKHDTYRIVPMARQDVDSYRDANGILHRNTVSHTVTTIKFSLIPMYKKKLYYYMNLLYSKAEKPEMKYNIRYVNPLKGGAVDSGVFYLGANHPTFGVYWTLNNADEILWDEMELTFIEY